MFPAPVRQLNDASKVWGVASRNSPPLAETVIAVMLDEKVTALANASANESEIVVVPVVAYPVPATVTGVVR
jgi:hypothetical protein